MSKSLFILDSLAHEEEAWREFEAEGLEHKFVLGRQYLGYYLVSREELADCMCRQVESWSHRALTLPKIDMYCPAKGMGLYLRKFLRPGMDVEKIFFYIMPYHAPGEASFWCSIKILNRNGAPLESGTYPPVLYPTKL